MKEYSKEFIKNKADLWNIPLFEAKKCVEKYGNSNYSTRLNGELHEISNIYNIRSSCGKCYPRSKDYIGKITLEYLKYDYDMMLLLQKICYHDKNIHEKINARASYVGIVEGINTRSERVKQEYKDSVSYYRYINE